MTTIADGWFLYKIPAVPNNALLDAFILLTSIPLELILF